MTEFTLTTITTIVAICLYFYMSLNVGMARTKYNVPAPATSGNADWERLYRVQMNTLEGMPIFLPLLWLCSSYQGDLIGAVLGLVWIIGRAIFMIGYTKAASSRSLGFGIQSLAQLLLLIGTIAGVVKTLMA